MIMKDESIIDIINQKIEKDNATKDFVEYKIRKNILKINKIINKLITNKYREEFKNNMNFPKLTDVIHKKEENTYHIPKIIKTTGKCINHNVEYHSNDYIKISIIIGKINIECYINCETNKCSFEIENHKERKSILYMFGIDESLCYEEPLKIFNYDYDSIEKINEEFIYNGKLKKKSYKIKEKYNDVFRIIFNLIKYVNNLCKKKIFNIDLE